MTAKKKNFQDATLLNVRVTRRLVAALELRVRALEDELVQLLAEAQRNAVSECRSDSK